MRSRIARFAMRRRATAVGALILVFVMAGTAFAASRGNAWRLGYVETLSAYVTGITGIHTAELLRIANTNTSSGARAIRAESRGTAAGTIYARNSGGGAAAEFVTNAGRAPFKVNRNTRVVNLNADLVDGLQANALLPGATLPIGRTLRGDYALGAHSSNLYAWASISFDNPLANAPAAHWIAAGGAPTAQCPGSATNPSATPGHLCVYESFISGSFTSRGFCESTNFCAGADRWGAAMWASPTGGTVAYSWGTWAVTAGPAAAAAATVGKTPAGNPAGR